MADNYSLSCHRIRVWTCNGTCLSRVTCNCKVSCATAHHIMYLYTHCTNSVWLASFPGLPALECEHWSCAGGRASYFFVTWAASKVERRLIVHGCTRSLRTGKRTKVAGNLLHTSSYQGLNIVHTKSWTHSWTMCKMLPFCSKNFVSCSCEKIYQAFPTYTYSHSRVGEPGNKAIVW